VYKQPRSIQVVVFADEGSQRLYLLLRRNADHGGFWQAVTGSLEGDETHRQAAVREVFEETGISSTEDDLIDLGLRNTFVISPQWLPKYEPGVMHNEEICFALRVRRCEVSIDPVEHDAYRWEPYEIAREMLYWESNKQAFSAANLVAETSRS